MSNDTIVIIGALLTLFSQGLGFLAWLRGWLKKTVSEPIKELQSSVDETNKIALDAKSEAQRAHDRLDRHLEGHNTNG